MLNKPLTISDIESVDPEFYNSLVWVRYMSRGRLVLIEFNPLTPTVAIWVQLTERQSARMSKITNDGLTHLAGDALYLCPCGNSGRQGVN